MKAAPTSGEPPLPILATGVMDDWMLLAEYLWLQQHKDCIFNAPVRKLEREPVPDATHAKEQGREKPPRPFLPPASADLPGEGETTGEGFTSRESGSDILSLPQVHPHGAANTISSRASQVSITAPLPLPGQREIAKALRPLARRVRSGPPELDVEATVEITARQGGIFTPRMKCRRERWLELNLIVDTGQSVAFWEGLADQIGNMLNLPGAFRSIRKWNLRECDGGWQMETPAGQPLGTSGILRRRNAQCVLILTDTLADSWFTPQATSLLSALSSKCPTALLHLLPPRLWERSGLGSAYRAKISSPARGQRNSGWRAVDPGIGLALPAGLPVPCLNLEASHFARFAGLMTASKGNSVQGLLLLPHPSEEARPFAKNKFRNSAEKTGTLV